MKLWIGSEFEGDIDQALREARNSVVDCINEVIEKNSYDIELDDWDCIAIIMEDDPFHDEVIKYRPKKRNMDFRLRIGFSDFSNADTLGQQKLFFQMLQRSLDLLAENGANASGINELRNDVERVARKNSWSKS